MKASAIVVPEGANTTGAYALIAAVLAVLMIAVTFGTLEEVAARRIIKACHQQKQFAVGKETFRCELIAKRLGGGA